MYYQARISHVLYCVLPLHGQSQRARNVLVIVKFIVNEDMEQKCEPLLVYIEVILMKEECYSRKINFF